MDTRLMSIAAGELGTLETLRIMAGLARDAANDPNFQDFARSFRSADHVNAELYHAFKYRNEEIETLFHPVYNLGHLQEHGILTGDCDDIAMFYAAVFTVLGIPCRFVAMKTKKTDTEFSHVVVEAFENNRWKRFDPTVIPGMVQIDYGRMIENV